MEPTRNNRSQMVWRRMAEPKRFLLPNCLRTLAIELEHFNGRSANRADSNHRHAFPTEMEPPCVLSGIKNGDRSSRLRILSGLACALSQGTRNTRQSEIRQRRFSTGYYWHDVINVKRGLLPFLGQAAVFATPLCTTNHHPAELRRDVHVTACDRSIVGRGGALRKVVRLIPPSPRLHAFRNRSTRRRYPVCREAASTASEHPLGDGTWPNLLASRLPSELHDAYMCAEAPQESNPHNQIYTSSR